MSRFTNRLAGLGFKTYAQYLKSPLWHSFRAVYEQSDRPQACAICGLDHFELHHQTYERLGCESLDDVVPLCRDHHQAVHQWLFENHLPVEATDKAIRVLKPWFALPTNRKPTTQTKHHRNRKCTVCMKNSTKKNKTICGVCKRRQEKKQNRSQGCRKHRRHDAPNNHHNNKPSQEVIDRIKAESTAATEALKAYRSSKDPAAAIVRSVLRGRR